MSQIVQKIKFVQLLFKREWSTKTKKLFKFNKSVKNFLEKKKKINLKKESKN